MSIICPNLLINYENFVEIAQEDIIAFDYKKLVLSSRLGVVVLKMGSYENSEFGMRSSE